MINQNIEALELREIEWLDPKKLHDPDHAQPQKELTIILAKDSSLRSVSSMEEHFRKKRSLGLDRSGLRQEQGGNYKMILPYRDQISTYFSDIGELLRLGEGFNMNLDWHLWRDDETKETYWRAEKFRARCPKCLSDQYEHEGDNHDCLKSLKHSLEGWGVRYTIEDALPLIAQASALVADAAKRIEARKKIEEKPFKADRFAGCLAATIKDLTTATKLIEKVIEQDKKDGEESQD